MSAEGLNSPGGLLWVDSSYCTQPRGSAHMTEQLRPILGHRADTSAEKHATCAQAADSWELKPHREPLCDAYTILGVDNVL